MANKYFKTILIIVLFFSFLGEATAQPTPPKPKPGVPIDGGIVGLLILGVGYAVKKIYDNSEE